LRLHNTARGVGLPEGIMQGKTDLEFCGVYEYAPNYLRQCGSRRVGQQHWLPAMLGFAASV
jgi:hypothetical protein